jgi:hypothetical protein
VLTNIKIFALQAPYAGLKFRGFALDVQIVDHNLRPQRPTTDVCFLNDILWDTIQSCWAKEPSARPSLEDVSAVVACSD